MNEIRAIESGWSFAQLTDTPGVERAIKEGEWLATHAFPTTVHVELLKLKKIPDPVRNGLFPA
jgi:beta-mannosidase